MNAKQWIVTVLMSCAAGVTWAEPADESVPGAEQVLNAFLSAVGEISGYEAVLTKRQRIDKELQEEESIQMKHRRSPDCRYMVWLPGPSEGREMIYCPERYEGKIKVHQPGMFGWTMTLDPNGSMIKRSGNLRPAHKGGLFNMANTLRQTVQAGGEGSKLRASVEQRQYLGQAVNCVLPEGEAVNLQDAPYPVGKRELCFYQASGLPAHMRLWHEDGRLMEEYGFQSYTLNPNLSDADFDVDNQSYDF